MSKPDYGDVLAFMTTAIAVMVVLSVSFDVFVAHKGFTFNSVFCGVVAGLTMIGTFFFGMVIWLYFGK